jgi:hypothetical protein
MEETKPQSTKLIEETKPRSRVMDLEDNPPMFQDYNVGPIKLSYLASRTTEILEQYSLRKRPRSRVLDVEEPEPSSKKNGVASKRLRVAPKRPCFAAKSRLSENADATLRHALLGNANNHLETNVVAQQVIEHPQCYPDTQTDGVLSSIQIERAWLCEESLHCFGGSQIEWSFVYKYASQALKRQLRDGTELLCDQVAEATAQKRKEIRLQLQHGYRRPIMARSIAFHRLALRRGDSPATPAPRPPLKKRQKQMPPDSHARYRACPPISAQKSTNTAPRPDLPLSTPKISNALSAQRPLIATPATSYPPNTPSAELFSSAAKESKASSQKWDDMFECLVQFVKDRKAAELKGASDKEKEEWEWDGNVPTLYKVSSHVGADPNLLLFRFSNCVA